MVAQDHAYTRVAPCIPAVVTFRGCTCPVAYSLRQRGCQLFMGSIADAVVAVCHLFQGLWNPAVSHLGKLTELAVEAPHERVHIMRGVLDCACLQDSSNLQADPGGVLKGGPRLTVVCRTLTCRSLSQSLLVLLDLLRSQLHSPHSCGVPSRRSSRCAPVCCPATAGAEGRHTPHSCGATCISRQGVGLLVHHSRQQRLERTTAMHKSSFLHSLTSATHFLCRQVPTLHVK